MFSKYNEKRERNKVSINEIKNHERHKQSSLKRQHITNHEYETDLKKPLDISGNSNQEIKEILSNCSHCKAKVSQFITKKPIHCSQKSTQTTSKPFLLDLIQEKVEKLCRQNSELERVVEEREEEIIDRQQEIGQIQEKFTTILLTLSQELGHRRNKASDWHELQRAVVCDSDTPAYLKALSFDGH